MCARPGRRAGGLFRGEFGRVVAQDGHAAVGFAAQEPAEFGAGAAKAAEFAPVLRGVRVLVRVAVRGEEPVLAREAEQAAGGGGDCQGCEEGEQQKLEGGRNRGVQDRPRPGARCVGFDRSGVLVWHRLLVEHRQHRWKRKKSTYVVGLGESD
jgi:hypothetical protein